MSDADIVINKISKEDIKEGDFVIVSIDPCAFSHASMDSIAEGLSKFGELVGVKCALMRAKCSVNIVGKQGSPLPTTKEADEERLIDE